VKLILHFLEATRTSEVAGVDEDVAGVDEDVAVWNGWGGGVCVSNIQTMLIGGCWVTGGVERKRDWEIV
jgi:hypothetical protein